MEIIGKITIQVLIGLISAFIINKAGWHGYYAGYTVGAIVMLTGHMLSLVNRR